MEAERSIRVVTYNIHKGMSPLNRHVRVEDIAQALKDWTPDVLLLQEVQGHHQHRAQSHPRWPREPQHHYLADKLEHGVVYGMNAAYDHGHHGNAVLSRFALRDWHNLDITMNRFESRGLLHCTLQPEDWPRPLAVLCAHLNLLARDRRKQYHALVRYVRQHIPADSPLLLAGDFNDWKGEASDFLRDELGLSEVFLAQQGQHAISFPARLPVLPLDRIYVRGLRASEARVLGGRPWSRLSDHLPLMANLCL